MNWIDSKDNEIKSVPDGATGFRCINSLTLLELPTRNPGVQLHDEEGDVKERNGDISTTRA